MALLHRFLRLNDEGQTGIFTFIGTRTVTGDSHRDVTSKEFSYGDHRWAVAFARHEKTLGIYLMWRNPSEGMQVTLDYSFTLLNDKHFSQNLSIAKKAVVFTKKAPVHGDSKFVLMSALEEQHFMDSNGELQLEVSLSKIKSHFQHRFRINQSIFATSSKLGKMETSYFKFGQFDWSLSVYPTGRTDSQLEGAEAAAAATVLPPPSPGYEKRAIAAPGKPKAKEKGTSDGGPPISDGQTPSTSTTMTLYLSRHSGLDRSCRVKFNLMIGEGEGCIESGIRDEVSDSDGRSYGWMPRVKMADIISKGSLSLMAELHLVNPVSMVEIPMVPANPIGIPLYDKDKQAWELVPDTIGDTLKFRLIYNGVKHIPRNHIRYVSWSAYLLKDQMKLKSLGVGDRDSAAKLPLDRKLYFQYYVEDDADAGTLMDTKIPYKEIVDPTLGYLASRTNVRIQVEWLQTCLLFQSTYHHYDDITRVQTYQMRQDIQNLRIENELLERRLQSYEDTAGVVDIRAISTPRKSDNADEDGSHSFDARYH